MEQQNPVKTWREKNRYTQIQLSELLNVSNVTVCKWENGTSPVPPYVMLALEALEARDRANDG